MKILNKSYNVGKNNPNFSKFGKNSSAYKHGKSLKSKYCIDCKKKLSKGAYFAYYFRCKSCANKLRGTNWSEERKRKFKKSRSGKNHPLWKSGRSLLKYPSQFSAFLRKKIRNRDNYTCQCGLTNKKHLTIYNSTIEVHHIDYNKKNCKEDNLITLCKSCNIRANFNKEYWKEIYRAYIMAL